MLSVSDGGNVIRFGSGSSLTVSEGVRDVSWAADGSEAVYVTADNQVKTFRYDAPGTVVGVAPATPGVRYASPGYRRKGLALIMAVQRVADRPWRIAVTQNASSDAPYVNSPDDGRHYLNPDTGGAVWGFVYQTQPNNAGQLAGQPTVGMWDPYGGFRDTIANAANPAISPDGTRVAFVRSDGSHQQIYVGDVNGGNLVQVTSTPVDHDHPVWSPAGSQLAFTEGAGVATASPDGSGHTVLPGLSGVPAYQPHRKESVVRLAGTNRIATAVAVSQAYWTSLDDQPQPNTRAQSVVLARSDMFADALGGGVLAAAKQGPLLLTSPLVLDRITRLEIQRILAPGKTVYLLGGTGALSTNVEDRVRGFGYHVERLSGEDRYSTAVAIATAIDPTPQNIFVATGADFPDALAAGAVAGSYNPPGYAEGTVLVLTNNTTVPTPTRNFLNRNSTAVPHTIGGQANIALGPVQFATHGKNRYETAQKVAYRYFDGKDIIGGKDAVGVATGTNWPDALAGGALMGTLRAPLLLTDGNATTLSGPTQVYLDTYRAGISTGYIFGGPGAVVPALADETGHRISGPAGYLLNDSTTMGTGQAQS